MARQRRDILFLTWLQDQGYYSSGSYKSANGFFEGQHWTEMEVREVVQDLRDDGLIDGQFEFLGFLRGQDPAGDAYMYSAQSKLAFIAITPKGERFLDGIAERNVHLNLAGKNLVVFWVLFACVALSTLTGLAQLAISMNEQGIWPWGACQ